MLTLLLQVLVWDVSKQCGLANAFRQGPSRGAMEMSFEYTTLITVLDLPYPCTKSVPHERVDFNHTFSIELCILFFFSFGFFVAVELGGWVVFVHCSFKFIFSE